MIKVALVHGFIRNEVDSELRNLLGEYHAYEYYCEGGYDLTLVTDTEILEEDVGAFINAIYEHEDDIPVVETHYTDAPVFVGIQEEPYLFTPDPDEDDCEVPFLFVGGFWGYGELGMGRYSE